MSEHPCPASRSTSKDEPASFSAAVLFPGRSALRVAEIAKVLRCTERHVVHLIAEYELTGGESGLKGFSIASGKPNAGRPPRGCWRVAVSDFDAFIIARRRAAP